MLRALGERAKKGVDVRVIGSLGGEERHHLKVRLLGGFRLHTRTIIRDRREAFVGSQSLRKAELDSRREVGVIVRDAKVVAPPARHVRSRLGRERSDRETRKRRDARRELKKTLKANMRKALAAGSARERSGQRSRVKDGRQRNAERERNERHDRKGGEGSRARAGRGNVE